MAEIVDIRFKFGLDAKPLADAQAKTSQFAGALAEARQELAGLGEKGLAGVKDADLVLAKAAATVELLGLRLQDVEAKAAGAAARLKEAKAGTAAWREAAAGLAEAEAEAAALQLQLKAVTAQLEQAGGHGGLRGVSTGLMRVGQVAGGLGFTPVAGAAMLGNDLLDLAGDLPRVSAAVVDLGAKAQALPGILGALASAGAAAGGGLGATAAGLGALLLPLAPLAVALGAVVAVVKALEGRANAAAEAQRRLDEARWQGYEDQQQLRDLLLDADADEVRRQEQHAQVMAGLKRAQLETEVEALVDASQAHVGELHNVGRTLVSGFFDNLFSGRNLWDEAGFAGNLFGVDRASLDQAEAMRDALAEMDRQQGLVTGSTLALLDARAAEVAAAGDEIDALERSASARTRVADLAASKTAEQLNREREANRQAQAAAREVAAAAQARVDALNAERAALLAQGELGDEQVVRLGTLNQLLDVWNGKLEDSETRLAELTAEAEDQAAAAPLVAAREAEAQAVAALDAELERDLQIRALAAAATREGVREQLAALEQQQAAVEAVLPRYQALAATSDAAAARVGELGAQLADISAQRALLQDTALPAAFANEARAAWQQGVERYGKYQDDLAALESQAAAKRAQIAAAGADKLADLEARRGEAITKIEQDLAGARVKTLKDFARKETEIAARQRLDDLLSLKRHQRELGKLAVGRDVAGFIGAQEDFAFEQGLQKEARNFEARARKQALDQDLAALKEQGQAKLAETKRQFDEQAQAARDAAAAQRADLEAGLEAEGARRREALEAQLRDLEAGLAGQTGTAAAGYAAMERGFTAFLGEMEGGVDLLVRAGGGAVARGVDAQAAALEAKYGVIVEGTEAFAQELETVHAQAQGTEQANLDLALRAETEAKRAALDAQARDQKQLLGAAQQAARSLYDAMAADYGRFVGALAEATARLGALAADLAGRVGQVNAAQAPLSAVRSATPAALAAGGGGAVQVTNVTVNAPAQATFGAVETPATAAARLRAWQEGQLRLWNQYARLARV